MDVVMWSQSSYLSFLANFREYWLSKELINENTFNNQLLGK